MVWNWIPNAITLTRMALAAPLAWLIIEGSHIWALVLAVAAGASDGLDGFLAKRFHWQSRIGGLLDPIADKLLLLAAVVGLSCVGDLPWWLTALIVGRDLVIVAGAVAYNWLIEPLRARPTLLSKSTTVAQIVLVLAALILGTRTGALPSQPFNVWMWVTAVLTATSGIDYVITWSNKAVRAVRARNASP